MIQHALQYAGRGWRVFPCQPRGKKPLTRHGFKDATVAPTAIEAWWRAVPDANIGIATGVASGLLVVDLDGEEGIEGMRRAIAQRGDLRLLPATPVVRTGRGYHIYYDLTGGPELACSTGTGDSKGVDIRADGGYVLAPPSIHPSGAVYAWIDPTAEPALAGLFIPVEE